MQWAVATEHANRVLQGVKLHHGAQPHSQAHGWPCQHDLGGAWLRGPETGRTRAGSKEEARLVQSPPLFAG